MWIDSNNFVTQVLFPWIFFLLAEKDQEQATSSRVRCSRAMGISMYANMNGGWRGVSSIITNMEEDNLDKI